MIYDRLGHIERHGRLGEEDIDQSFESANLIRKL